MLRWLRNLIERLPLSKLYIKQKVFSLTEHFDVFDSHENTRYQVDGSFFKFPKQFHILDAAGNEVAIVKTALMPGI